MFFILDKLVGEDLRIPSVLLDMIEAYAGEILCHRNKYVKAFCYNLVLLFHKFSIKFPKRKNIRTALDRILSEVLNDQDNMSAISFKWAECLLHNVPDIKDQGMFDIPSVFPFLEDFLFFREGGLAEAWLEIKNPDIQWDIWETILALNYNSVVVTQCCRCFNVNTMIQCIGG